MFVLLDAVDVPCVLLYLFVKLAVARVRRDVVVNEVFRFQHILESAPQIARELGINKYTVYRYNKQVRLKGE